MKTTPKFTSKLSKVIPFSENDVKYLEKNIV